jgi:hypothetical protein
VGVIWGEDMADHGSSTSGAGICHRIARFIHTMWHRLSAHGGRTLGSRRNPVTLDIRFNTFRSVASDGAVSKPTGGVARGENQKFRALTSHFSSRDRRRSASGLPPV